MSALNRATKSLLNARNEWAEVHWCHPVRSHHSTGERFEKRNAHRALRRLGRVLVDDDLRDLRKSDKSPLDGAPWMRPDVIADCADDAADLAALFELDRFPLRMR